MNWVVMLATATYVDDCVGRGQH